MTLQTFCPPLSPTMTWHDSESADPWGRERITTPLWGNTAFHLRHNDTTALQMLFFFHHRAVQSHTSNFDRKKHHIWPPLNCTQLQTVTLWHSAASLSADLISWGLDHTQCIVNRPTVKQVFVRASSLITYQCVLLLLLLLWFPSQNTHTHIHTCRRREGETHTKIICQLNTSSKIQTREKTVIALLTLFC